MDADILNQLVFRHPPDDLAFQQGILILQPVTSPFQFEMGMDTGQKNRRPDRLGDVI
jgi:hypothetical protein